MEETIKQRARKILSSEIDITSRSQVEDMLVKMGEKQREYDAEKAFKLVSELFDITIEWLNKDPLMREEFEIDLNDFKKKMNSD